MDADQPRTGSILQADSHRRSNTRQGGINAGKFDRIRRYSPEFQMLIREYENEFVISVKGEIIQQRAEQARLLNLCTTTMNDESEEGRHDLSKQLMRRNIAMRSWLVNGIPRSKASDIITKPVHICSWHDPLLGIYPFSENLLGTAPLRTLKEEVLGLASKMASAYPGPPNRQHARHLARKIEFLEDAVLSNEPFYIPDCEFDATFLVRWRDEVEGIFPLRQAASFYGDRLSGEAFRYAMRLLNCVRVISHAVEHPVLIDYRKVAEERPTLAQLQLMICPNQDELTALLTHLALMCQIDLGSTYKLMRGCLINEAEGFVDIRYVKSRKRGAVIDERVRDGSLETPGGVIRAVQEITALASQSLKAAGSKDADMLWLFAPQDRIFAKCRFIDRKKERHPWWKFCQRNTILLDDGDRLEIIHPARFRKTVKAHRYSRHGGDLYAIADDHSVSVSRDHYADLPSLEETHDETVARGLRRALADVQERVVPDLSDIQKGAQVNRAGFAGGVLV